MNSSVKLVLSGFMAALLAACSTTRPMHDGPPNFHVDVSKIPDAVPKVEPPCRFGNKSPYIVRGQRYSVLPSSEGYDERGIASWYGILFHKHRTSCGEPYDMLSMTAASRVLPLPTYARITNLENGRQVIVKVNDRGPFEKHRIMDLSWAAAKKLGITGKGTGYIEVKAIDPRTWRQGETIAPVRNVTEHPLLKHPGSPIIYLQVGAFGSLERAKQVGHQVANLTHQTVRIQKKAGEPPVYRVQIGPVAGISAHDEISGKLVSAGFGEPMTVIE